MSIKTIKILVLFFGITQTYAQIDSLKMDFDFRTRAEIDNGQKILIPKDKKAETTVFSRARLNVAYHYQNLMLYLSLQDVRTWGETASLNAKNQDFVLNEAWAKYQFTPKVAIKVGRQLLAYDDERLIGGLDWAMQGRSFDAMKGIFEFNNNSKMEAVITYNNDDNDTDDIATNEIYNIIDGGEKTKSMQVLHYQYQNNKKFKLSGILMNNVLQNITNGSHYDMLTIGINAKKYFQKIGIFGSAYYQTGKNTTAQDKSAYQFSLNADFIFGKNFNTVLGTEWLSGKDYDTETTKNKSFSPMYGTNHKFNGYMDYFYVGNHFNSFGLNDYYLKTNAKFSPKSNLTTNIHTFTSNGKLATNTKSYLGTELDLVFAYKITPQFNCFAGHSFMFPSASMELLKGIANPKGLQTWSWIGLYFSPKFKLK